MTADTRPARYTYPDLCHVEALLAVHAAVHVSVWDDDGYTAWARTRDKLTADRDAILTSVGALLCSKCGGTGTTQWRHRLDGVCFRCNGDGWSAKGRRALAV